MSERIVISYGTYDLFHYGHVQILKRMKQMGDKLIIGCSSDGFNDLKGKKSFFNYQERSAILSSCKYVDLVFPEERWEQKIDDINRYKANLFVMGDDWEGKFDFIESKTNCSVLYLSRTIGVSSTNIKLALSAFKQEQKSILEDKLKSLLEDIKSM